MTDRRVPQHALSKGGTYKVSPEILDIVHQAVSQPGEWFIISGPYERSITARIRASQANKRKRWRSLTSDHPDLQFKSWTDETHQPWVLVRLKPSDDA